MGFLQLYSLKRGEQKNMLVESRDNFSHPVEAGSGYIKNVFRLQDDYTPTSPNCLAYAPLIDVMPNQSSPYEDKVIDRLVPYQEWRRLQTEDLKQYTFHIDITYEYNTISATHTIAARAFNYYQGTKQGLGDSIVNYLVSSAGGNESLIYEGENYMWLLPYPEGDYIIFFSYCDFIENQEDGIKAYHKNLCTYIYEYTGRTGSIFDNRCRVAITTGFNRDRTSLLDLLPAKANNRPNVERPPHGQGTGDRTTQIIALPDFEKANYLSQTLLSSKFLALYQMTAEQLKSLGDYLWSSDFFDTVKKNWASPMDCIVSLKYLPFSIESGGNTELRVAGVGTGIVVNVVEKTFSVIDFGSIYINEYYGGYPDYTHTEIKIFLPYIGFIPLKPDAVMNKTISVQYRVELLTGSFTAFIYNEKDKCPVDILTGNMATEISLSQANYSTWVSNINPMQFMDLKVGLAATAGYLALDSLVGQPLNDVVTTSFSSNNGLNGYMFPFIVLKRPIWYTPEHYDSTNGTVFWQGVQLKNVNGFTKVFSCHVEHINAPREALEKIESALKSGIII